MSALGPIPSKIPDWGIVALKYTDDPLLQITGQQNGIYLILHVHTGKTWYVESDRNISISLPPRSFLPVSRGIECCLENTIPTTLLILGLSADFIEKDSEIRAIWDILVNRRNRVLLPDVRQSHQLELIWHSILSEQVHTYPGRIMAIRAYTFELLVCLARLTDVVDPDRTSARVAQMIEILKGSFSEKWDLDLAAKQAGLSRRYFSQLFKKLTGQTFLEYLTDLRLSRAAQLLQQEEYSIVEAILASGFDDISHFYRLFRKRYGMAPGKWLKSSKKLS